MLWSSEVSKFFQQLTPCTPIFHWCQKGAWKGACVCSSPTQYPHVVPKLKPTKLWNQTLGLPSGYIFPVFNTMICGWTRRMKNPYTVVLVAFGTCKKEANIEKLKTMSKWKRSCISHGIFERFFSLMGVREYVGICTTLRKNEQNLKVLWWD